MKNRVVFGTMAVLMIVCIPQVWATPLLFDWMFYDTGSVYSATDKSVADLPAHYDSSNFDWDSGLGTITVAYNTSNSYSFISFFDHETVQDINTFYNEFGTVHGSPSVGQSWEIDEPGYVFGDIYDNVLAGELDNTNAIPAGEEDDVSMAMGWNFFLPENETALVTLTLSELTPTGFYLAHNDPEGPFYFSSSLVIEPNTAPVPEPSSFILFSIGFVYLAGRRYKIFSRR